MLILAFDTATDVATSALVSDGEVLGERASVAATLLEDVDALFRQASARPRELDALVVGTGPGSFTGTRVGLSVARGLALALGRRGSRSLDPRRARRRCRRRDAGDRRAARRGLRPGPRHAVAPGDSRSPGSSASAMAPSGIATLLEARGARSHPTATHVISRVPRLHAALADAYGPVEAIEPVYVREPDARPGAA